jgi:hypothetical protein
MLWAVGLNLWRLCLRLPIIPVYYPGCFSSLGSLCWVSACCAGLACSYKSPPARIERTPAVKHAAIAAFDKGALVGAVVVVIIIVIVVVIVIIVGGDVVVVAATKLAVIVDVAGGAAVAVACCFCEIGGGGLLQKHFKMSQILH